ncbi:hypothetical protein JOF48_001848 [Arthrobacter stackebrandtii]|uniref:Plasmid pRiA4b Orf3-like domain-containing protein n=1 Tax=Arthrobacter stackebrandtii TaxID=272161 RepID=A0ABS4YW86_9MICC|nr:plasmid pRiA4b ORF-3 family protein [Arthrobacter stackebrandtii]MBP2413049.1 hypothetical protein [Arthrobacter stackebrandtii]PYH01175.1 hypothetical protein CVV67_06190 [Arthrobacter stackebrandtii]
MAKDSKARTSTTSVSGRRAALAVDAVAPAFAAWCNNMPGLPEGAVQDLLDAVRLLASAYFKLVPASDITSFEPLAFGQAMSAVVHAEAEEDTEFIFVAVRTYLLFLEETKAWTGGPEDLAQVFTLFYDDGEPLFPDIDQPELSEEEELAGLEATSLAQRMEALLRWIGPGAAVTSTGALKLKDIEAAAAAVGVAAKGAKAGAKREQLPGFNLKNMPEDHVPTVKSMYEVPLLAKMWAALEGAGLIGVGATKVWLNPKARILLEPGNPERRMALGIFITAFLTVAVTGEQDWAPWVGQAAAAQIALLYAACQGAGIPAIALTDPESLDAVGLDEYGARLLRERMDELAELGLVSMGETITVPPAVVPSVVALAQSGYADEEDESYGPGFGAAADPFAGPDPFVPAAASRKQSRSVKKDPNAPIYQLKVTLKHLSPPIWRRLLVRSDVTLGDMHRILQASFEWDGSHLHAFQVGGRGEDVYGLSGADALGNEDLDENAYTLGAVLSAEGDSMEYTYDFGDDWEHLVKLERVLPADPKAPVARCTGGRGRGPAEDSGGAWGWANVVEAVNDPKHPEHQEYRDWLGLRRGETFDAKAFDKEAVTTALARLF